MFTRATIPRHYFSQLTRLHRWRQTQHQSCSAWQGCAESQRQRTSLSCLSLPSISFRYLATASAASSTTSSVSPSNTRLIGIIAHIDAGKTTTTERCLYYAGVVRHLGDVDRGDTVMDFLPEERERGITIKAACITFPWQYKQQGYTITIIDTPGHVDFTQEVECSLRVCDSCVLILDAVKGVQAQTHTVYTQAQRYQIPCLAFVNKMDREGADLQMSIESIQQRLDKPTLLLQIPLFSSTTINSSTQNQQQQQEQEQFVGVIDIITQQAYTWRHSNTNGNNAATTAAAVDNDEDDGTQYTISSVDSQHPLNSNMQQARDALFETLAEYDETFLHLFLSCSSPHTQLQVSDIQQAIRRVLCSNAVIPVLCGASLRNKGVQPLLDAIIAYAPSPRDRNEIMVYDCSLPTHKQQLQKKASAIQPVATAMTTDAATTIMLHAPKAVRRTLSETAPLLVLAFKVTHDLAHGAVPLVYVRVYSGTLHHKDVLLNTYATRRQKQSGHGITTTTATTTTAPSSEHNGKDTPTVGVKERALKLYRIDGEVTTEVSALSMGEIGAIMGLKHTITGDTLIRANEAASAVYLPSIIQPDPVFFAAVEPLRHSDANAVHTALSCITKEDPSVSVYEDEETGQIILRGMGELHMEVVWNRLIHEYKIKAHLGKMRVAYRESVNNVCEYSMYHTKMTADTPSSDDAGNTHVVLTLALSPLPPSSGILIDLDSAEKLRAVDAIALMKSYPSPTSAATSASYPSLHAHSLVLTPTIQQALSSAVHTALQRGPLLAYALTDIQVTLKAYFISAPSSSSTTGASAVDTTTIRSCAIQLIRTLLRQEKLNNGIRLMEPVMLVSVNVEKSNIGDVVMDLSSKRRGIIREINMTHCNTSSNSSTNGSGNGSNSNSNRGSSGVRHRAREDVTAEVPLVELLGYANDLRSRTGGTASYSMQFHNYQAVPQHIQDKLINTPP